jgi:hypothetical protein
MSDRELVRASDIERDEAAERLRQAGVEGRLTAEELEDRLASAFRAQTRGELDALVADLPRPRRAPLPRHRRPEVACWAATSLLLVTIWALTGMDYFWPVWPILGWGFFVVMPWGPGPQRHRRHKRRRGRAPA